ncbi:MAG TPA: DNA polymerase III subunit delta' [Phycisphaerae bacterium]|nr:DNA polymerase III subunit delta' [Phycisphaerae bacterium]
MQLSEVRHQERAVSILRRALRSGRTHHAYLFEGPAGVGKELAARALAAQLLCEDDQRAVDADPCGRCPACRVFAAGNHPDFHLIHRGLHKLHPEPKIRRQKGLFLVIDVVRHFLIEPATMKPTQGRRRVFVIRDAERMNDEAQNALLKTLEEPPGTACLILVTSSADRLLPTIRSRCQRIPFGLLPTTFVARELQSRAGLDPTDARALAGLADGRLGVALQWHALDLLATLGDVNTCLARVPDADPETFGKTLVALATELAMRAQPEPTDEADMEDDEDEDEDEDDDTPSKSSRKVPTDVLRDAYKLVLLLMGATYRDALLIQSGAAALRVLPQSTRAETLAREASPALLDQCILAIGEAEVMLDRNVAPQLVGERLAVALLGELPVT